MWTFEQKTGTLRGKNGFARGIGYSGHNEGKNNPAYQDVHDVGPLPQGLYTIHAPVDTTTHGPYVLRLEPSPDNQMFGRAGFLMHGDSKEHPGSASLGCIIMPRDVREFVWNSGDHQLQVVAAD